MTAVINKPTMGLVVLLGLAGPLTIAAQQAGEESEYSVITFDSEVDPVVALKRQQLMDSPEVRAMRKADRQAALEERKQMQQRGFIVVSEEAVAGANYYITGNESRKDASEVIPLLAFESFALSPSHDVVGVYGVPAEDGNYYDVATVIKTNELGYVVIQETTTGGQYGIRAIRGPKFDLTAAGHPALLTVSKTASGERGSTSLMVLLDGKVMTITLPIAIERGTELYDQFFELAATVY